MYFFITILLLCISASLSNTDGCFYEDFVDGKYSALSDSCSELAENPWKFETYGGAKMSRPSFSTSEGFIRAESLEKQCVANNFPLSMTVGSELFIAYRATGSAVLSVELIDFHTSKTVDFIVLDLAYDQWSLDSFTIRNEGDFIFNLIAFTPEGSSLIVDSVAYVDDFTELDACMYNDGSNYNIDSVEEPPMNKAIDKDESEINNSQDDADNSQHESHSDTDVSGDANAAVIEFGDSDNDAIEAKRFSQDVANCGEVNDNDQVKTDGTKDSNEGVENGNRDNENSSEDEIREGANEIEQDSDETPEDSDEFQIGHDDMDDDTQNKLGETNNSNEESPKNDNSEEINYNSQQVQEVEEGPLSSDEDGQDSVGNADNENDISNDDNAPESDNNENETVEFDEISNDLNDRNQDDMNSSENDNDASEQRNDTPEDNIEKDADIILDERVDSSSEDDTDDFEDLKRLFDDEINNIEIETTNFFEKVEDDIQEKIDTIDFVKDNQEIVRNLDDPDLLESSQPFSEHMPVGAEWVTFLTVVGVVLSIACLLVLGAVLLMTRRRTKTINDYPYYHYELPHATQKTKNDTFPIYTAA